MGGGVEGGSENNGVAAGRPAQWRAVRPSLRPPRTRAKLYPRVHTCLACARRLGTNEVCRQAEEIGAIADSMFLPEPVERALALLKETRHRGQ